MVEWGGHHGGWGGFGPPSYIVKKCPALGAPNPGRTRGSLVQTYAPDQPQPLFARYEELSSGSPKFVLITQTCSISFNEYEMRISIYPTNYPHSVN
jgi:hypothetical protein